MYCAAFVQVVTRYCGIFDNFDMGWLAGLLVVLHPMICELVQLYGELF